MRILTVASETYSMCVSSLRLEKEKKRREADEVAAAEMVAKEALGQKSEGGSLEDVAQTIPMEHEMVQAQSLSLCFDLRVFFICVALLICLDVFWQAAADTGLAAVKTESCEVQKDLKDALAAVEEAVHQTSMDDGDLRRKQLTMRAEEQQKAADKKEENKKKKEAAEKAEPKARGRPRTKALAAGPPSPAGPVSQASALPAESSEQPVKRRRIRSHGHQDGSSAAVAELPSAGDSTVPAPKAGAKARAKAHAVSRRQQHHQEEEVPVNEADKLEMQALLMRFRNTSYNKEKETLHKGKFEGVQISVYWTRSAVGVRIWTLQRPNGSKSSTSVGSHCACVSSKLPSLQPSCRITCQQIEIGQRQLMASVSFAFCVNLLLLRWLPTVAEAFCCLLTLGRAT